MIDAEVSRLRNLRVLATRARSLACVLEGRTAERRSLFRRSAVCCWQIARAVTGTLRAHPYAPFQRGLGAGEAFSIGVASQIDGRIARHRGRAHEALHAEVRQLARRLADARALTLHQDLSEVLGRLHARLVRLIAESAAEARAEALAQGREAPVSSVQPQAAASPARGLDGNWPYLAF